MLEYWDDSARLVDDKWGYIFGTKLAKLRGYIASTLKLPDPASLVFAANTHEFIVRLLSCFDGKVRILTTNSEFHSANRQFQALEAKGLVEITRLDSRSVNTLAQRLSDQLQAEQYDIVFASQVFFDSAIGHDDFQLWIDTANDQGTTAVLDGYHGFLAVPTDLSGVADKAFYLSGGYKYAQGGEGCCFLHVPASFTRNPVNTGWYAELADLGKLRPGEVPYPAKGQRFSGATMDYCAAYRQLAVFELFEREGISVEVRHRYVRQLQHAFLEVIDELGHPLLNRDALLLESWHTHGHFLVFELPTAEQTQALGQQLKQAGIHTDWRANRLRFGFGLYHEVSDYARLMPILAC